MAIDSSCVCCTLVSEVHRVLIQIVEQYTVGAPTGNRIATFAERLNRLNKRGIVDTMDGTTYVGVGRVVSVDCGKFHCLVPKAFASREPL